MDLEDQLRFEHFLFQDRKCKKCGVVKSLTEGFYLSRKDRGHLPSSYSYECKQCTKKRIINARKTDQPMPGYPDW
jgi:hypothetical protein